MTSETTATTARKKASKAAVEVGGQEETLSPKRKTVGKAAAKVAEEKQPLAEAEAAPKRRRSAKAEPAGGETVIMDNAEPVATKRKSAKAAKPAKPAFVDELPLHSEEERQQYIATLAYLRAESRGFAPGNELNDWLEAEAEYLTRFKPA